MPALARTEMFWPAMEKRSARRRLIRSATWMASSCEAVRSSMIANSSPPRRASVSDGRTQSLSRRLMAMSSSSPAAWPRVSLIVLKSLMSMKITDTLSGSRSSASDTRSANSRRLARSVRGSWEAWCSSSRWSSFIRHTVCPRRSFSSATLVLLASVSNSLTSSAEKRSTRPDGLPIIIAPMQLRSPASTANMPAAQAALLQVGGQRAVGDLTGGEGAELRVADERAQLSDDRGLQALQHGPRAVGADRGAQRVVAVRGEEDDLGHFGAEGLERLAEQPLERGPDLRAARQRPRGLVEELQAPVALALGDVGLEGEVHADDRHGHQDRGAPVVVDDGRGAEADAGVDRGDGQVGAQRVGDLGDAEPAVGQGHRGGDEQHGGDRGGHGGQGCRGPDGRVDLRLAAGDGVEDDHRDAVAEQELPEVEGEADRG